MTASPATAEVRRVLTPPERYQFGASVRPLLVPGHDPCGHFRNDELWLALRTPEGPATLHLARSGGELLATGHGPGAAWVAERADAIAGLRDDLTAFAELAAGHPVVARLARTFAGVRMPATGQVFPRLLRAILEQKVTGKEAHRSYREICRRFGEPAPGPAGLVLPPDPAAVAATPYWEFHPFGVEQRRTQTLVRAAQVAGRLERCAGSAEAVRRMTALPGIGPWTAAEVVRVAYGDADAVSVGDFHIPNTVAYALAGEPRGTDERMLTLLAPFPGHRGRVCDLLAMGGLTAPKYGPRMPVRSFARF
ncbi:3-methyladenine DNA glycosylase [Actinoplanes palleronii]|uniref:3-methyladenine DNA glycosylase n=1 Tax=Actinoplanes palleronii TaxID=113570 RepID=A0ABQ4B4Q4_9ACTN|nr:3-methyladenine DNA glycosylase [Actinoplanes palleronii]